MYDKVLIITDHTTLPDISRGTAKHLPCPQGYTVGAIVRKGDWIDRHMPGVYGEAVFVNQATRDVKFVDEDNGLSCTVLKDKSMKCVARIHGKEVIWA